MQESLASIIDNAEQKFFIQYKKWKWLPSSAVYVLMLLNESLLYSVTWDSIDYSLALPTVCWSD